MWEQVKEKVDYRVDYQGDFQETEELEMSYLETEVVGDIKEPVQ